ncbi:MAG: glycosyltransferase family 2 protein [Gammaproteobacteria bacterium]|nr:MAG: glycosyltransferase family 2 protein [Gammaproteobacteria bacterium]
MTTTNRAIAIFAHNEESRILNCLNSVKDAIVDGDKCFVLNNGSKDDTGKIVADYSKHNPFCELVEIEYGDKSNAWNHFVHKVGCEARMYIFLDGDCEVLPNSLSELEKALSENPQANAIAAVPTISVSKKNREEMLSIGGLAGNLYALSADFINRIRASSFKIPVGLIGDDSFIGNYAYRDLKPENSWDKNLIVVCEKAEFTYIPLSILSYDDMSFYYRRKIRYSLRRIQNLLLKKAVNEKGISGLPERIEEVYGLYPSELKLSWRGIDTWFDLLAIRRIKKVISQN